MFDVALAFPLSAGLVAAFNPCGFAMLPTWIGYFIGTDSNEDTRVKALTRGLWVGTVLTLGFIYGAYMTETFRGAILAIPRGQIEAGISVGMNRWTLFRRITWPQMIRYALPGFTNNWLVLLKATALISIVGLQDLVYNNAYFFPGMDRPGWISVLSDLRGKLEVETLLVGHGYPSSKGELTAAIDYLTEYSEMVTQSAGPEELVAKMKERWPNRLALGILDLQGFAFR